MVDPAKVGLPIAALILVNVEQHSWQAARDELAALPGLEYLAFTSGGFDMVLLVRVPDVVALRDVVLVRLHGSPPRALDSDHLRARRGPPPRHPAGRGGSGRASG